MACDSKMSKNVMKKKVAIITTHHYPNYGNKLQNYALQTILQHLGYKVETINDVRSWPNMNSLIENWKILLHYITRFRLKLYHIKMAKFIFWSKRYIRYSSIVVRKDDDANKLVNKYDYFVVGADQIWNPEWPIFSNPFGFATFAKKEQKVAYAPSLGVSEMIAERLEEYKIWLRDWKALSCREYEGARIIEDVSGQKVPVLVDPTLLLTKNGWEKVASKPIMGKKYTVLYYLREISDDIMHLIKSHLQKEGIDLYVIKSNGQNDTFSPSEFISLFKYAEMIYTDSFHGCIFALQFHRPLVVLHLKDEGKDKISRISTLFSQLKIPHNNFPNTINEYLSLDWTSIDANMEAKRNEGINYLKTYLN